MVATVNPPKPHRCGCTDCEWRGHETQRQQDVLVARQERIEKLEEENERLRAKIEAALASAAETLRRIQFSPAQERETVEFVVGMIIKALQGEEEK